jgi:2,3-bisphosphoglycerate-independent phosphoglycerate mutase
VTSDRRLVFVFVDGLGLGPPGAPDNPVASPGLDLLANFRPESWIPPADGGRPETLPPVERRGELPYGGAVRATDPSLGIGGLPQSATGQTTILTGVNAALVLGRHLYGYPTRTLQRILLEHSLLKRLVASGKRPLFLNAFRSIFFELGDAVWTKPLSATTWANRAAGLLFMTMDDLEAGRAVYQDITHDSLRGRGLDVPPREPERAGEILAAASREHDFTLFEFFQTDKAGHARDREKAIHELTKLERFLGTALAAMDLTDTTLVLTSDHGNVEDLSVKTHTHNPVPTLVFGAGGADLLPALDRLERFTPAFLDWLGAG